MRHVHIQSAVGKFLNNVLHIVFLGVHSVLAYNITLYFVLIIMITNTHDTTTFFFKSRSI